jgi:Icc-related predicted phosphoesterase
MRTLLVSDLHYDLRKLDWVLAQARDVDLLVVAGDTLDIASSVPLDAQIAVALEYLSRFASTTTTVVCSGNHDLDHRTDSGEKATRWLHEARSFGVAVDGDSVVEAGWLITSCAWWEGPETLALLQQSLDDAASLRSGPWMWVYHGPPDGPLSWTGSRHYGDPELPALLERHQPDIVLCGHVHEAPFVEGGGWVEQVGPSWLFNGGREWGDVPAHVLLDLDAGRASWRALDESGDIVFETRGAVAS